MGRIDSLSGAKRPGFRDTSNTGGHDTDQDQQKKSTTLRTNKSYPTKKKKTRVNSIIGEG